MEKKKVAFFLIKALSDNDRGTFIKKIKCGKTTKSAERHEKLFAYLESLQSTDEINSTKLVKMLKLSSSKKLTPLYGELISDIKNHLITSELKKDELVQELLLQKALCNREEVEYIKILHEEIRERISENADKPLPPEVYHQYAQFYKNLYSHPHTNTSKESASIYLSFSENNLDTSYWISKLRLLIEKANRGIALAHERFLLQELKELPDLTQYNHNNDNHILSIYARVYKFALAPFQKEDLEHVLTIIDKYSFNLPKEDKERIFTFLMGIIDYYRVHEETKTNLTVYEVYKVYKMGFTNLWLVQDDGLMYFEDFINMLYLAFYYKDSSLLESIGSDYTQYIHEGYDSFISMLSKAYNFFLHKQWEAVLKSFSNQELPNKEHRLHFIVQRNNIEIKALFEAFVHDKIEIRDILGYLEKHYRFIQRRNTYSDEKKLRNFNFIKFLRKLYTYLTKRITFNFNKEIAKKEITAWIAEVEKAGTETIDQPWLKSIGETLLQELGLGAA
ncbi:MULTISPECIES: hypothetical protein [unclassified Aureispira]|uniref:hypothetical protein n=1 Tax=unclassified Aureispira TaxID=2649989 RepID=UPI00069870FF|nr:MULTISPECIES: hypothetical protein [unclassified Aureispira]WMX13468.1 hypothetical protein QP953_21710 [Aureispira sp. CCB-E]